MGMHVVNLRYPVGVKGIRHRFDQIEVVSDHDHGVPICLGKGVKVPNDCPGPGAVDRCRGFVGQDQQGPMNHGPQNSYTLTLTSRKILRLFFQNASIPILKAIV